MEKIPGLPNPPADCGAFVCAAEPMPATIVTRSLETTPDANASREEFPGGNERTSTPIHDRYRGSPNDFPPLRTRRNGSIRTACDTENFACYPPAIILYFVKNVVV